ncbi:MAG: hypothetical protein P1V20_05735 [Verrucomicrobiales bacterium]|nr:hypothetical protein [Verrucomicrobiales bacterium]
MSEINRYHSYKGLPPLAGVGSFERAAGPGLSIEDCVARHKRFHYSCHRLWALMLARLTAEPIYELKMGLSHHAYLASEHVTLLRDRVAEMRHPPLGLDKVPHPELETLFDEILMSESALELLTGIYRVAFPALRDGLKRHLVDSNPLVDAPSVRIFRIMLPEIEQMIEWGESAVSALQAGVSDQDLNRIEGWADDLQLWLTGAGGLDGTSPAENEKRPEPTFSNQPWKYDKSPRRDERFPDPYNMGVHAEEFLYDDRFEDRDKVLMMYYKRLREIDVPEMMASILYEMAVGTGDEEIGGHPWLFYRDLTRQLWDEARHAMMGEVGFAKLGVDWGKDVMINFTWSKGLNEQLTPTERHAVLWFIEQGLMTKTGKRFEWEVGKKSGDPYAELIQDYDWADEVLHARIGRDWYVKNFDSVKAAAEYGSACWDKVMSDWEAWKRDGLTEHRNWWPDLYSGVCRLRGEEPNPEVLSFAETYAASRADLQRISASG